MVGILFHITINIAIISTDVDVLLLQLQKKVMREGMTDISVKIRKREKLPQKIEVDTRRNGKSIGANWLGNS